jgi:hypothetical protein
LVDARGHRRSHTRRRRPLVDGGLLRRSVVWPVSQAMRPAQLLVPSHARWHSAGAGAVRAWARAQWESRGPNQAHRERCGFLGSASPLQDAQHVAGRMYQMRGQVPSFDANSAVGALPIRTLRWDQGRRGSGSAPRGHPGPSSLERNWQHFRWLLESSAPAPLRTSQPLPGPRQRALRKRSCRISDASLRMYPTTPGTHVRRRSLGIVYHLHGEDRASSVRNCTRSGRKFVP